MLKKPWCSLHKIRFQSYHCDDHRSTARSANKARGMSILKVRLQYFWKPLQGLYARLVFKHLQQKIFYGHLQSWFEISCDSCHWRKFYLRRHCRRAWDQWFDAALQEQNRSSVMQRCYVFLPCVHTLPDMQDVSLYHVYPTSWRIPSSSPWQTCQVQEQSFRVSLNVNLGCMLFPNSYRKAFEKVPTLPCLFQSFWGQWLLGQLLLSTVRYFGCLTPESFQIQVAKILSIASPRRSFAWTEYQSVRTLTFWKFAQ